jgi:glycosyltransferase involved in cell wall biosynthesis
VTRVGYDLSILRHPHAGTARYAEELLRALRASGAPGDMVYASAGLPRASRGHRVLRYANLAGDLAWWAAGIQLVAARRNVDVWFSPANILPLAILRPTVATIHDANFLVHPEAYDRGYRIYAERIFRHSAAHADAILTDSKWSAGLLVELLNAPAERIRVAYPGLEHALRIEPGDADLPVHGRYALFVGQTEPHKNVGLLIDAWREGVPLDLHLVIAGRPGRDHERLRAIVASDARVRNRVHFAASLGDRALARLYADATCFLFPSRTEGFGFPPLEAMARGIPTAVASAGSLPEVTAGAALVFDPDDAVNLAKLVTRLAEDGDERARLSVAGRQVAGGYRWGHTADIAWDVIRVVTQGA